MSDDLLNSEVVDQFHNDLLVERLTDSDGTEISNDIEKRATFEEAPKTASWRVFLQPG
jgi:hypothetical protein